MSEDILDRLAQEREIKTIGRIGGGGGVVMMSHDIVQEAIAEITRLRAEIDRLREERRWIPVEERLPDRYEGVIVAMTPDSRGVVEVCEAVRYFSGGRSDFETDYGVYECSHWQPLPAPPSEGEVEG